MKYEVKKLTPFRLLSIYAYDAIKKGHNMYALVELDVTDIRQKLRSCRKEGRNISFFGFLLSAIAKTLEENKELNHIRCGKKICSEVGPGVPGSPQEQKRADIIKKELESHLGTDNVAAEEFTFAPGAFLSSYPICGFFLLLASLITVLLKIPGFVS